MAPDYVIFVPPLRCFYRILAGIIAIMVHEVDIKIKAGSSSMLIVHKNQI